MFSLPRAAASAAPRVRPPDHAALPVAPYYIRSPPSTLDVSRETRYLSALRERNAECLSLVFVLLSPILFTARPAPLAPACLTAARVPYLAARASSPLAYGALSSPYARDYREPHHLVGL